MKQYIRIMAIAIAILTACSPKEDTLPEVDDVCTMMDDIVFMQFCYDHFDVNHDGKVSKSEAEAVNIIDMIADNKSYDDDLRSLKGIEYFTNLKELYCNHRNVNHVDVSKNRYLEILGMGDTDITTLDVSECQNLKELYAWSSELKTLILNNPLLEVLYLEDSPLEKLDISKSPNLKTVSVQNTKLTELDITKNEKLEYLSCGSRNLTLRVNCVTIPNYNDKYKVGYDKYVSYDVIFLRNGEVLVKEVLLTREGVNYPEKSFQIAEDESYSLITNFIPSEAKAKVEWTSSDKNIFVVKEGVLTGVKVGEAELTVTCPSSGVSTKYGIRVTPGISSISLDYTEINMEQGGRSYLTATVLPRDVVNDKIIWSSSNQSIVQVNQYGDLIALKPGSATITAKAECGGKTATCKVVVDTKIIECSIDKKSLDLKVGDSENLSVIITPENATNKKVRWHSMNNAIATVDSTGHVTAKKIGYTTIWVNTLVGSHSASCSINVTSAVVPITDVLLSQADLSLVEGKTATLTATVFPSNATNKNVTWSSSNSSVASVSTSGVVTAKSVGKAIITAKAQDGGKTGTCEVTVNAATVAVTGLTLSESSVTINTGQTYKLSATIYPSNATNKGITWASDNYSVASVSSDGTITAKTTGTAKITAKSADGGKTATCSVTVKQATVGVTGITLDKTSLNLKEGETATLKSTITPSNASNKGASWSTSNSSVAVIATDGTVIAKSEGTATITIKTSDGGYTATCKVTVSSAKVSVTGVSMNNTSLSLMEGKTATLSATVSPSNATDKTVTWSSSNNSVASVSSTGVVTAKAAGSATITAKTNDGSKTASCSIIVTAATIAVTGVSLDKTSHSLSSGWTFYLHETITPSNATDKSVTWSSSNTSVATVNSGTVTAKSRGTAIITVKTNDGGKTASCTVIVTGSDIHVTGVSLNKTSLTIEEGKTEKLTASVSPATATDKSLSWSSSNTSVATVSSDGTITAKAEGKASITVKTKDGSKTASCSVTVTKKQSGLNPGENEGTGDEELNP